jgi:hypothetical protein
MTPGTVKATKVQGLWCGFMVRSGQNGSVSLAFHHGMNRLLCTTFGSSPAPTLALDAEMR